ncbi:cell wall biosynthesis glycosyltransferase-like protein [Pseudomonas sp. VLB120]|nr:cell wall biosynthesis glycosyltransferase-like protein [Pseudomonas sp. VLB120]
MSVCIITYNHERYIASCLESVIGQKVKFPFEIIVADDFSTDATRQIIDSYVEKYPNLIRAIYHEANVGVCANYKAAHDAAQGDYVAHCDGDDYWYADKLQTQVEVFDRNPGVVQCWTCADIVDDEGKKLKIFPSRLARAVYPRTVNSKDIALSYALVGQHSTQMYRRSARPAINDEEYLDYWVAYNLSLRGASLYLKSVNGAYRLTASPSVTRNTSSKKKAVDYLARHLVSIYELDSTYGVYVKANLITRFLFSRIKNHDVSEIKTSLRQLKGVRVHWLLCLKSFFYFLVQKI